MNCAAPRFWRLLSYFLNSLFFILYSSLSLYHSKEKAKTPMNLSLGFPEFTQELAVATKPSLEAVVARFRSAHQEPDSPVRAIHHQAATEGEYAEMPAGVDARLRAALGERGDRKSTRL